VLFPVNVPAGPVLHPGQFGPVSSSEVAIGLHAVLGPLDPALLRLQMIGLTLRQLPGLDPLPDALLLARLPGIDAWIVD